MLKLESRVFFKCISLLSGIVVNSRERNANKPGQEFKELNNEWTNDHRDSF
jgi:hypothetical protein